MPLIDETARDAEFTRMKSADGSLDTRVVDALDLDVRRVVDHPDHPARGTLLALDVTGLSGGTLTVLVDPSESKVCGWGWTKEPSVRPTRG